jgi:uncharacterized protein (TIGR03083 family)
MSPTPQTDVQPLVAAQYRRLADELAPIPVADWDAPSLCEGWRVREVIAHLTMPARYDQDAFMTELQARDFDFARLSNDLAARDGAASPERLVGDLRDDTLHQWVPPEGSSHDALNHVAIHSLDVTVPLGRPRPPDEVMRVVLDDLAVHGVHEHFGTRIAGRRLEATDLDWSTGTGTTLRGDAGALALTLCGRRVPGSPLDDGLR